MSALRSIQHDRARFAALALATLAAAVVNSAIVARFGALGVALPVAGVAAVVLLSRPRWCAAALLTVVVIAEREGGALLGGLSVVYEGRLAGWSPVELLLVLTIGAVTLDQLRSPVSLPPALAIVLGLYAAALLSGIVVGSFAGVDAQDLLYGSRQFAFLLAVPLIVACLVRDERDLRRGLAFGAALALLKGGMGILAVVLGRGAVVEGSVITFYEPLGNGLVLLPILVVSAALLQRIKVPFWLLVGSPVLVLSLALSFRRSFWIGATFGILLVILAASTPIARRLALPAVASAAVGIWVLGSIGFQAQGPLVERAQTLEPSKVQASAEDRYRLDERANAVDELRASPLTGLGIGIPWTAEHPLAVNHPGGRQYVHGVVLWHWLKLGLLGVVAYALALAVSCRMAWVTWRRHPDPDVRVFGAGALCWLAAMAVVETTASFTAVDGRYTVLAAAVLGLLAVSYAQSRSAPDTVPAGAPGIAATA